MKTYRFDIYFGNSIVTVYTLGLRNAIILASAKRIDEGKTTAFHKVVKIDGIFENVCFDYGTEDAVELTY